MRILYGAVVVIEMLLILYCAFNCLKHKSKLDRWICVYEWATFLCAVAFILFAYVPGNTITTFGKELMLALFDWILIALLFYTQYYTRVFSGITPIKVLVMLFALADTVMLISNSWTHSIFEIKEIGLEKIRIQYVLSSFWYQAHFVFTYSLIVIIIITYLYMILHSSKIYRHGYIAIVSVIAVGFLFDIATIGSYSIYDISIIIYGAMAIMIYFLTYRFVPNTLIESMLSLIVDSMNSGVACFDSNGRCVYSNDLMTNIYQGNNRRDKFESIYKNWLSKMGDKRKDVMKFESDMPVQGETRHFEISYQRSYDEKKNFIFDYLLFDDVTNIVDSLKKEQYRAEHDSLTGLLNREQFYVEVEKLLHADETTKYSIICSNIKDFKFINEIFGIEKGDKVLIKQANLMQEAKSEKILCARMLNDRFAMCMPKEDVDETFLASIVENMRGEFPSGAFHLHMYMGVYDIHNIDESVSIMCDKANIAADTIKDNYERTIAHYDEHLLQISIEERRVIGEFDKALESDEFVMFLQPQVDKEGMASGAEALVRWQHPTRGLLTPYAFIRVLENAGLIYKLDRYIWEKAAAKLAEWKQNGKDDYHISVNISTKDFYIIDIYETFSELVKKYDISPQLLRLEITETALMTDLEKNMQVIRKLQADGFMIEIDDFGSGYSSLNMLKDISADVLKIDMGFLRESENEVKGHDILETVIELAGKIGMEVVTEGVETRAQLEMLSQMGCEVFQGYLFSKPIPVDEFEVKYLK